LFVGYPLGHKGWRLYDLETHEFFVSRDVVFQEHVYPFVESENKHEDMSSPLQHGGNVFDDG